jgi:hypothetical protein
MSLKDRCCHRIPPLTMAVLASLVVMPVQSLASEAEAAEELPLKTSIVSATIYSQQAQVVRRGEVRLSPGSFRLVCGDLPREFTETSLNVVGTGLAGARIVGIDLRRTEKSSVDSPRYKELADELDDLNASVEQLRVRGRAIERRRTLAESIGDFQADKARDRLADGTFATGEWRSLLTFFEEEALATDQRLEEIKGQSEKLQERMSWVRTELAAMQVAEGSGREVVVDCEVTTPGIMTVELSYIVPGASWHPEYSVRYIERDSEAELTYSARIAQATGEDWKGVSVVLSTATPHVGAAPPELSPQYLGLTTGTVRGMVTDAETGAPLAFANVTVMGTRFGATTSTEGTYVITDVPAGAYYVLQASCMGYKNERQSLGRLAAGRVERVDFSLHQAALEADEVKVRSINTAEEAIATQPGVVLHEGQIHVRGGRASEIKEYVEPQVVPYVEAELLGSEFAANLAIPKPVDLETGGEPRRSMVVRELLPGRFVLESVPRLSDHVFLKGSFVNSLEIPLLSGTAEVYVETVPEGSTVAVSNFVGQERVAAVAPGEEFTMHLGVDQNVKVDYELRSREVLSRAKSATVRVRYTYVMTVESFKRGPAEVWVLDRVPVSMMKDVKVDAVEIVPAPATRDEDGLLAWQLMLAPGDRQELSVQYEVEYPSSMTPRDLGLDE